MYKICVAIAAYNNSVELEEAIKSVIDQTVVPDGLVVFDNTDIDDISAQNLSIFERYSEFIKISKYHKSQYNMGSASAYEYVTKWAYNNQFDWIFILDQDGIMKEDCLEKLISKKERARALCSLVVATHDKITKLPSRFKINFWGGIYPVQIESEMNDMYVDSFGTCGTMFHRSVFDDVGYFDGENLFAGEDGDFGMRMHKKNIPLYWVMDSIVYHPDLRKKYSVIAPKKTSWFIRTSTSLPPFLGCFRKKLPKYDQQRRFSNMLAIYRNLNFFQKFTAMFWSVPILLTAKLLRRDIQVFKTLKCYIKLIAGKAKMDEFAV